MGLEKKIDLQKGEEVLAVVRRSSVISNFGYFLGVIILIADSFFLFYFLQQGTLGLVIFGMLLFVSFFIFLRTWYKNYFNFVVVSDKRVVDVCRTGLFNETVSAVNYSEIKDAYIKRNGFLQNIFNMGDVVVEIRSDKSSLIIEKISNPMRLQSLIKEGCQKSLLEDEERDVGDIYDDFIRIIPELTEGELCEVKDLVNSKLDELDQNK